jgi:hypothetical protein
MSNNKKKSTNTKKPAAKKAAAKKAAPKKKPAPKVDKIEIDVPTQAEVKDLIVDTVDALKENNFKFTPAVKKGLVARVKSWFKVS